MKKIFSGFRLPVMLLVLVFALAGCSQPNDTVTPTPSGDAALSGITIKGAAAVSLGTPDAALGSETAGTVVLLGTETGTTAGTTANAKASVTKIVKYASGTSTTDYAATFADDTAYDNDDIIAGGDFFVFQVTAENGAKLYYRIDVTIVSFMYTLAESNVAGESNFANVRFYVYDELFTSGFYNTTTYEQVTEALGNPVTAIYDIDENFYLYAVEFTDAGSGTVVKSGVETSALTGTDADEDIAITLTNAGDPPEPPSAEIDGGDVYVEAKKANFGGTDGVAANIDITINLENAAVNAAFSSVNAVSWFSETVAGLTYTANAAAGAESIVITVNGVPTVVSTETAEIEIPAGVIKDSEGAPNIEPLAVNGTVEYDIDAAENPAITDFTFTPVADLEAGSPAVAAGAVVGSFGGVTGGTAGEYTYALTPASSLNSNASFVIAEGSADLKVKTAPLADGTYQVQVVVTDVAGETLRKTFQLTVTVGELTGFTFTVAENLEVGSGVNTLAGSFSDPVGGKGPYTYTLVSGDGDTDNASFEISWGELRVRSGSSIEAKTYSVRVQIADGSNPQQTVAQVCTFTVSYPPALPASAAISESYDGEINAVTNNSEGAGGNAANEQISITLTNSAVKETIAADTDVTSWFNPVIEGLSYKISSIVYANYTSINIKVTGTPAATSIAPVTITIPAELIVDSNYNPTITEDIAVGGTLAYAITAAPENVVKIGNTPYTSLQAAVGSITNGTITVTKDFELSDTIVIPPNKNITITAETDGLSISRAAGFDDYFFEVRGRLTLGITGGAVHNPVLVIDGKKRNGTLLSVYGGGAATLLNGAELRNGAGEYDSAVSLYGTPTYDAYFYMEGGIIAGNSTGVFAELEATFLMTGGIIYGNDEGDNSNTASVKVGATNASVTIDGNVKTAGTYTDTFGTAP